MSKSELDYFKQFETTFKMQQLRATREGFEGEDAQRLAVTGLIADTARAMAEAERFHASQLAFRDVKIKELERRNAWQVERIKQLGG